MITGRARSAARTLLLAATAIVFARNAAGQRSLTLTFQGSDQATIGVAYSATVSASGGVGPYTFVVFGLPPGLISQADGFAVHINGTPNTSGSFHVSVTAHDPELNLNAGATYPITVSGTLIAMAPAALPDGVVGVAYGQRVTISGGTGPFLFTLIGSPPPGLTLASDGTVTGTPTQAGVFSFGIAVADSAAGAGRIDYEVFVTTTPTPRLEITIFDGGVPWGNLPVPPDDLGPTLNYTISYANLGTARATSLTLHLVLDQSFAADGQRNSLDIPVADLPPNGSGQYVFSKVIRLATVQDIVGNDPLAIQTYQVITEASAFSHETGPVTSVAVTPYCDNVVCTTFCPLRYLTGYPCAEIGISADAPDTAFVDKGNSGLPYHQQFSATGGTAPYRFSGRDLPPGLSINPSGLLSGIPDTVGQFDYTVGARDSSSGSCGGEKTRTLVVCPLDGPLLSPGSRNSDFPYALPDAIRSEPYKITLDLTCGTGPYRIDVSAPGDLPPGLTVRQIGQTGSEKILVEGTPTMTRRDPQTNQLTPFVFSLHITDAFGRASNTSYTLLVRDCFIVIGPDRLPPATVGQPYNAQLDLHGGVGSYTVHVDPGCDFFVSSCGFLSEAGSTRLNNRYGIQIDSTGVVFGVPKQDGHPTFTVTFQDADTTNPCYGSRQYTLDISPAREVCPPIDLTPESLPSGRVGMAYSATIAASGGAPPYKVGSDGLPTSSGLWVDAAGHVVGTPLVEGAYSFDAFAQDSRICFGNRSYNILVDPNPACPRIYLSPGTVPAGKVGVPYIGTSIPSNRISASGGVRPYRLSLASMPPALGLAIDPDTGELSGTPGTAGTYPFIVTATDSNPAGSCSGSALYTIEIQPGQLSSTSASENLAGRTFLDLARGAVRFVKETVTAVRTVLRDLTLYYKVRDQFLSRTPGGQEYIRLYYRHSAEITQLLRTDAALRDLAFATVEAWEPQLRTLVAGFGSDVRFTQSMADTLTALLTRLKQSGSSSLAADIAAQQASINFPSWVGLTMQEAQSKLDTRSCVVSDSALCLNANRFRVDVSWQDFQGRTGSGHAVSLTADTGYFWFFSSSNVELVVKALDGRAINGHFWIFYGALSNVAYTLTVTDTATGTVKTYSNPSGQFASLGDTGAFPGAGSALTSPFERSVLAREATAGCAPTGTSLCLNQNRFKVDVAWRDFQGNTGVGQAVPLTSDTGTFWFFNASNVELIVKVLDGRAINGKFWAFYGALSNVQYTVTLIDTQTGAVKTYTNPSGVFASVGDTGAFGP